MVEEMLLSPVLPVIPVFKLKTGQIIYCGYVAYFRQESVAFIDVVPRLADKILFIIVKRNSQDNTSVERKVIDHEYKRLGDIWYSTNQYS